MNKSDLYRDFRFAVKFINRNRVAYRDYFEWRHYEDPSLDRVVALPAGAVLADLGPVTNDFRHTSHVDRQRETGRDIDRSTSRAYRVEIPLAEEPMTSVCVTHETGLEFFLIAAGSFIGLETAKFSFERFLEFTERRINEWFQKRGSGDKSNLEVRHASPMNDPMVERIAIRTPWWEVTIDGRFTEDERNAILSHFSAHLSPRETAAGYFGALPDTLREKTLSATREVLPVDSGAAPQVPPS